MSSTGSAACAGSGPGRSTGRWEPGTSFGRRRITSRDVQPPLRRLSRRARPDTETALQVRDPGTPSPGSGPARGRRASGGFTVGSGSPDPTPPSTEPCRPNTVDLDDTALRRLFLSRAASLNLPRCVHSAVGTARSLIRHLENAENLGFERGSDRAHSGPLAPYGTSDPLPRHRMCVRAGERRNVGCQARRGSRSEGNSPMGREGFPSQIAGFSLYEHRNALPILKLPT